MPVEAQPPCPRKRRRRVLIALGVVAVLLAGSLAVATSALSGIDLPEQLTLPASTTLYYSDGKTVLAQLGETDRQPLDYAEIDDAVKHAAVAARDPDFWTNSGSSISRDVVRTDYDVATEGTTGKVKLAILAWKLEGIQPKEQILERYLNDLGYGRGAYGVEAAARQYFGKSARRSAPEPERITAAEAIVLVAMLAQPNPTPEAPGFDPTYSDAAKANAQRRWAEIRDEMVALSYLTDAQAKAMTFPDVLPAQQGPAPGYGRDQPVGLVVNHVLDEVTSDQRSPLRGFSWEQVRNGGFDIVTTIDRRVQQAVEAAADPAAKGSLMAGQPANLQAAAVVVQPGTGRVLGYYGGPKGTGGDYAGIYRDAAGDWAGYGAHPPGAAFFPHTLATALKAGISLRSRWEWRPHDLPGRAGPFQVRNQSTCPTEGTTCTLLDSTRAGVNVPYYALTVSVTPAKVLETARDAGIRWLWTDERARVDLTETSDTTSITPSRFDTILGLGQYRVTVLDQASAMATYADQGRRAEAHFVVTVRRWGKTMAEEAVTAGPAMLTEAAWADLCYALSRNSAGKIAGQPSALATGTWSTTKDANVVAHAWAVGYTRNLALAVWLGNTGDERQLLESDGSKIYGSTLPAQIYRRVLTVAHQALKVPVGEFPPPAFAGRVDPPGAVAD